MGIAWKQVRFNLYCYCSIFIDWLILKRIVPVILVTPQFFFYLILTLHFFHIDCRQQCFITKLFGFCIIIFAIMNINNINVLYNKYSHSAAAIWKPPPARSKSTVQVSTHARTHARKDMHIQTYSCTYIHFHIHMHTIINTHTHAHKCTIIWNYSLCLPPLPVRFKCLSILFLIHFVT